MTNVLYKTKMCNYSLMGNCRHGSSCLHAHSPEELRASPDFQKTKLCRLFQKGLCKDKNCTRAHGEQELRRIDQFYKKKVCKYWKEQGSCIRGPDCYFAHSREEMDEAQSTTTTTTSRSSTPTTKAKSPKIPPPPPPPPSTASFRSPGYQLAPQMQHSNTRPVNAAQPGMQQLLQQQREAAMFTNTPVAKMVTPMSSVASTPSIASSPPPPSNDVLTQWMNSAVTMSDVFSELHTLQQRDLGERANIPFVQAPKEAWASTQIAAMMSQLYSQTTTAQSPATSYQGAAASELQEVETMRRLHQLEMEKTHLLKLRLLRHFSENQMAQPLQPTSPMIGSVQYNNQQQQQELLQQEVGHGRHASLSFDISNSSTSAASTESTTFSDSWPLINTTAAALQLVTQQTQSNQPTNPRQVELTNRLIENLIALTAKPLDHDQSCPCGSAQRCSSTSSIGSSSLESTWENKQMDFVSLAASNAYPPPTMPKNHTDVSSNNNRNVAQALLFPYSALCANQQNSTTAAGAASNHHLLHPLSFIDSDVEKMMASLLETTTTEVYIQ